MKRGTSMTAMFAWRNMRTRFGFDEGCAVPTEASEVRNELIRLIDIMKTGDYRLEEFSGGSYNSCMILIASPDGRYLDETEEPDEIEAILEYLDELDCLGDMVQVEVMVSPEAPAIIEATRRQWKVVGPEMIERFRREREED